MATPSTLPADFNFEQKPDAAPASLPADFDFKDGTAKPASDAVATSTPSRKQFMANGVMDTDKASVAIVNSKMLRIPATAAYHNSELVNEQMAKRGAELPSTMESIANDIKVGAQSSIIGLTYRAKMPEILHDENVTDKFIQGLSTMVADLPFYLFGGVVGGVAGGAAGSEVPVAGNVVGAAAGATMGAWAVPEAMRKSIVLGIQRGEIHGFSDLMERTIEVTWAGAKGALLGRLTGLAGETTLPVLSKTPAAATAMKLAQQAAALTTLSAASEGRIPDAQDFAVNAALITSMHYSMGAIERVSGVAPKVNERVQREYADTGATPNAIAAEALRRVQTEPVENVIDHINEIVSDQQPTEEPQTEAKATEQRIDSKAADIKAAFSHENLHNAAANGFIDSVWQRIQDGKRLLFSEKEGTIESKIQAGVDNGSIKSRDDIANLVFGETPEVEVKPVVAQVDDTGATGIKNASVDQQRAARGLAPLESDAPTTREGVYAEAKTKVDSGEIDPVALADDVNRNPRGISDVEVDALNYGNAWLSNQFKAAMDSVERARADGDPQAEASARKRALDIEGKRAIVEEAARKAGTQSARALRARQEMIKQDYSLDRSLQRARVASKDGVVSPDVRDRLETLTRQLEGAQAKVEEYESLFAKRQAQGAVERIQREVARTGRKVARAEERATLDEELHGLVKEFDSLLMGRMSSNPMFDPEVIGVLGKMARNRVESGITHIEDIVDDIHAKLTDIGHDVTRREIMDAISGYGKVAEMSKDEIAVALREARRQGRLLSALEDAKAGIEPLKSGLERDKASDEVKALQQQVRQAMRESGLVEKKGATPEQQLARYKTYITNRIAMMEQQLATGEFTTPKRKPIQLDEEAMRLKVKAEETRNKIDQAIEKQKHDNRTGFQKTADAVTKWRRAGLLTGWTTLGKLTKAAMDRMGVTPVEELLGGVLSQIPGIDEISKRAPMHGGGFNPSAEVKAVVGFWKRVIDVSGNIETLKSHNDSLDILFGGRAQLPPEVLGYIGAFHGLLKGPEKYAEFFRRVEIGLQWAKDNNYDIEDPRVQSTVVLKIQSRAYDEALRAINMQKNMLTNAYNIALSYLNGAGEHGQMLASGLRFLFPMVRIATNIPAETVAYTPAGLLFQGVQVLRLLTNKDKMGRSAMDNLSAHDFDNVMRGLKKGSVGLAFAAIGFGLRKNITGYYTTDAEKRRGVTRGTIKIGNVVIPSYLSDTPPMLAIQLAATVGHISDHYNMKGMSGGLIAGAVQATQELAEHVPFYGETIRMGRKFRTPEQSMVGAGEMAGSLIVPRIVSQIAEATDPLERQRKARTFTDAIKLQVPGLRESVPRHH